MTLEWNRSQLGRTPAEIDAYCQVRGDSQASEYCLWNWRNGFQDYGSCFESKRREYKGACVKELLAQESYTPPRPGVDPIVEATQTWIWEEGAWRGPEVVSRWVERYELTTSCAQKPYNKWDPFSRYTYLRRWKMDPGWSIVCEGGNW